MIYHMYFTQIIPSAHMHRYIKEYVGARYDELANLNARLDVESYLGHAIKNSVDDTYIFITTVGFQGERFNQFLEDYELKDLIVQEAYVTNHNYTDKPRNLRLTIIQSKDHFQRKENEP